MLEIGGKSTRVIGACRLRKNDTLLYVLGRVLLYITGRSFLSEFCCEVGELLPVTLPIQGLTGLN